MSSNKSNRTDKIGILDPTGIYDNPLTNKPYSETYRNLAKIWSKFPAYSHPEKIIQDIKDNNVILVVSGTGSGKTVLFPKYLLHVFNYNCKIAITLPKQINAKSSAEFAAATLDVTIGKEVGYQYRNSGKNTFSTSTKLLYCTDGTLVARLMTDPELKEFDAVIIDEAHERKVNTDFLLYLLRKVLYTRPEFKLIIMSATINQEIFKQYYKDFKYVDISIGAKTNYPIKSIFLDTDLNIDKKEYLKVGIKLIHSLMKEKDKGGILFFVTSVAETNDMCELLAKEDKSFKDNNVCIPVFSGMSAEQEKMAIDKDYYRGYIKDGRKIIVATNVAESSLTIEGITYVIDSGLELRSSFDPINRINILEKVMITHAQAKQRMGRTGRTGPGICYHLYTKEMYDNKMEKFPAPAIKIESISYEIIKLMAIPSIGDIKNVKETFDQFLEPPNKQYVNAELKYLKTIKLIDDKNLTDLGKKVVELQIEPIGALSLMMAYRLNCFREVSAILAMIDATKGSIGKLFIQIDKDSDNIDNDIANNNDSDNNNIIDKKKKKSKSKSKSNIIVKLENAKAQFNNKYGDHIALLKIFGEYEKRRENQSKEINTYDRDKLNDWCYRNFLKRTVLEDAYQNYLKIKRKYKYKIAQFNLTKPDQSTLHSEMKYKVLSSLLYGSEPNVLKIKDNKIESTYSDVKNIKLESNTFLILDESTSSKSRKLFYNQLFRDNNTPVKAKIVSKITQKSLDILKILT